MLKLLIIIAVAGLAFHYQLAQPVFNLLGQACLFLAGL